MTLPPADVERFEAARSHLAAVAYRMLGSAEEAEDIVQEAFLRWQAADRTAIEVPEAWLTKVVTNLCLNQLTSARARRETYPGQWLPEPLLANDPMLGPAETVEQRDSVSIAILVLLEQLTPGERAVYVLREAFDYSHAEIAEFLDISEAASQQSLARARRRLDDGRARAEVDPDSARRVVEEFLTAAVSGELDTLVGMLREEAVAVGDGGGKVPARPVPIVGGLAVAKFLRGLAKPSEAKRALLGGRPDFTFDVVNTLPSVVLTVDDRVVAVLSFEVSDGKVSAMWAQANPEKLGRASRYWKASEHEEPLLREW